MNPMDVTAVVFVMAAISYMLGMALLSMPSKRVRSFAWNLVYDGATNIFFLFIVMLIPFFIGLALNVILGQPTGNIVATMNGQYDRFNCWLGLGTVSGGCISDAAKNINMAYNIVFLTLTTIGFLPVFGSATVKLWWAFISPAFSLLSMILAFFWVMYFFGVFLRAAWIPITSIGAVLYGLPGRIGRAPGAGIIVTLVVFYVGLPFMPVFVDSICVPGTVAGDPACTAPRDWGPYKESLIMANQTAMAQFGVPLMRYFVPNVKFQVWDIQRQPLGPVLLTVTNGTLTWQLVTLGNGTRTYGFPSSQQYSVLRVEYLNVSLPWSSPKGHTFGYTQTDFATPPGQSMSEPVTYVELQLPIIPFSVTAYVGGMHPRDLPSLAFMYMESSRDDQQLSFSWNLDYQWHQVEPLQALRETLLTIHVLRQSTPWVPCTRGVCQFGDASLKVFYSNSFIDTHSLSSDNGNVVQETAKIPWGAGEMHTFTIMASNDTATYVSIKSRGGDVNDYSSIESDPLMAAIFKFFNEQYMRVQVANSADLDTFTIPFVLKWLVLPIIYIIILGAIARDLAKALGGRGISLPGLG